MSNNENTSAGVRNKDFEDYVDSVKEKSEDLIKNVFPKKIQELNDLLETPLFDLEAQKKGLWEPLIVPGETTKRDLKRTHDKLDDDEDDLPPGGKKRKVNQTNSNNANSKHEDKNASVPAAGTSKALAVPSQSSGSVPCNVVVSKMIESFKPQIRQLLEHTNMLKMWVTFLIPKIEDGNNFGVSIQENCLGEIKTVESESALFNGQITGYHMSRAKLISKVVKYPHVEEYRRAVAEMDENEFVAMRHGVFELRNHYCALLDLISKNFEKIVTPRTSNTENLY